MIKEPVGKVIGGRVSGRILIRLLPNSRVGVGDLLIAKSDGASYFLKVSDLSITSSIPGQFVEDIAGKRLQNMTTELFDAEERFYNIAEAKAMRTEFQDRFLPSRLLPKHFVDVYKVNSEDMKSFLEKKGEIEVGNLRVGSEFMKDIILSLPAEKLIRHHILVCAATGKGKSNFAKVFLRGMLYTDDYSCIVFDPHGEYYGEKNTKGLRDHPRRDKVQMFTPRINDFPGAEKLVVYAEELTPTDFFGITSFTDAQIQSLDALYRRYGKDWVSKLILTDPDDLVKDFSDKIQKVTITSLQRKILYMLEMEGDEGLVFTLKNREGAGIFEKILSSVRQKKIILVDTSLIGHSSEKLVSSFIVRRLYYNYRKSKQKDPESFKNLPETMILFEEAPRVLGRDALASGTNIFETIAREGRKFKVGLCAITQMPSLLPREILSQMNTKIILGLPSSSDRTAVIESAPQNIEDDSTEIQLLDTGEALLTSPFIQFPLPVRIFKFEEVLQKDLEGLRQTRLTVGIE